MSVVDALFRPVNILVGETDFELLVFCFLKWLRVGFYSFVKLIS